MHHIPAVICVMALLLACGEKPKAPVTRKGTAPIATTAGPTNEAGPGGEVPPKPLDRTRGGVELGPALEAAGEARAAVREAAMGLAKDRAAGVKGLVAAGPAAKTAVLALLGSENLDELIGAMQVLAAEGDPTGARAEGQDAVLGLLGHAVGEVRDTAWETAAKIADGAALAKLLPSASPERQRAIVRLLASWDGEPVREALWGLIGGADGDLAIEAALAASAPQKRLDPATAERLRALSQAEDERRMRLALVLYRRFADNAGAPASKSDKHEAPSKDTIDRALASKDEALLLEGIRSTLHFAPEEREPLYEQLAKDPRAAVRAVTAEVLARHAAGAAGRLVDGLLGDPEGDVRMSAARARARFGPPEERVKALVPKLQDGHRGARLAAAVSLARPELVSLAAKDLARQLLRESGEARNVLLGALASSHDREGVGVVVDALGHADKTLSNAAFYALMTATGLDFGGDAGKWRAWLDKTYPPPPPPPAPTAPPGDKKR